MFLGFTYLKYSEAADANLGVVVSTSVELISVTLVVIFPSWSNCRHEGEFQGLSHVIQGKLLVNDAKKNLNDQAIITL